jgi:hypothetical protein
VHKPVSYDLISEIEIHRFVTFASDLGWKPGDWPDRIAIDNLGNKQPFVLLHRETQHGSLLWVDYRQSLGCIQLRVFND